MISIHMLPVGNGDCFILVLQDGDHTQLLVIDSGFVGTYRIFKPNLFNLLDKYSCDVHMLLTHIDTDHIGGYKTLFQDDKFKDYGRIAAFYYNTTKSLKKLAPDLTPAMLGDEDRINSGTKTGLPDAIRLEHLLRDKGVPVVTGLHLGSSITFCPGMQAIVLSPSPATLSKYQAWVKAQTDLPTAAGISDYKKDLKELMANPFDPSTTLTNASSISFLIEADGRRLLFLGDSCPADIEEALRIQGYSEAYPLKADVVKVSHHGSRHNTSTEMLRLICGKYFLISGSGGRGHPDKEALARIVQTQDAPVFCFNYDIAADIFTPSEVEKFHIQAEFRRELIFE